MKLKGISWFEQHAEKIVFATVAVIALAVLAIQFLTQPNMVKVGTTEVAPAQAYTPVQRAAESLRGRLESTEPQFPEVKPFTLAQKLENGFAPEVPDTARVTLGPAPSFGGIESVQQVTTAEIATVTIPAPASPVAASYRATISPIERIRNEELAPFLPAVQPFDKAWVSVEATVDGTKIRQALQADPEGPAEPLPLSWWRSPSGSGRDLLEVVAVEIERETIALPDGSTPPEARTIIKNLPGRPDYTKLWSEQVTVRGDVDPMLNMVADASPDILRPDFYPTIAGPEWIPPAEAVKAAAGEAVDPEIARLRRQLAAIRTRMDRITAQMDSAGGQPDREAPRNRDSGGGGGGKGGGRSGGGASPGSERPQQDDQNTSQLQRALDQVRAEETRVIERLTQLGDTSVAPAATPEAGQQPAAAQYILDNPAAKVWVHDVTAVPGATYRYRVRLVTNNPYFGRSLLESQQALAADSLMRGDWSEWTAPIEVARDSYYFITSAEEQTALSPRPRATAELYTFYYGFYRQARVSLEPGDPVVAEATLPDLKLADMDRLRQMIQSEQPLDMGEQPPGMLPPDGDPRGRTPDPRSRMPGQGMPPPGATPELAGGPDGGTPDWMNVDGPKSRVMGADATLLDVAPAIADATDPLAVNRQTFKVMLRDGGGRIVVRLPESDRSQDVYKVVEASAKAGETQGKPVIKPEEPTRPFVPPQRERGPRESRPPGGGGGGGSGGG